MAKVGRPVSSSWNDEIHAAFLQQYNGPDRKTMRILDHQDGIPEEISSRWDDTLKRWFG